MDARVTFAAGPDDGQGVGAGYSAQLFGGPEGTALPNLTPLFPTTTFRTSSAAAQGYVNGVVVEVPGVAPGQRATLVMTLFLTGGECEWPFYSQSNVITISVGGDVLPPANLVGLEAFAVLGPICVPEPSALSLVSFLLLGLSLGTAARGLFVCRWRPNFVVPRSDKVATHALHGHFVCSGNQTL